MSSLVGLRPEPRSAAARTIVLGALVVVLAVGVLSMHGLTSAEAPALTGPTSDLAAHGDGAHGAGDHDGDHDGLGHLGAICFWLAISGAVLLGAAELRRRSVRRRDTEDACVSPRVVTVVCRSFGRAPPALLVGQLRC